VGLLGLNAWVVLLVVPSLHFGGLDRQAMGGPTELLLAGLPLALLVAGVVQLGSRRGFSQLFLLALFPPAIGLAVAVRPVLVEREVFDPLTIGLGALSLGAYAIAAMHACARPVRTKPTTVHPSRSRDPVTEPLPRRLLRRLLLGLTTVGGLALVAMIPIWTGRADRADHWGEGADDGTVLTIIVATVAASFAIGGIVGPGLRAKRKRANKPKAQKRQLIWALAAACVAGMGWLLLRHFDAA